VSRSVITLASSTSPKRSKALRSPSSFVSQLSPPTNNLFDIFLFSFSWGQDPCIAAPHRSFRFVLARLRLSVVVALVVKHHDRAEIRSVRAQSHVYTSFENASGEKGPDGGQCGHLSPRAPSGGGLDPLQRASSMVQTAFDDASITLDLRPRMWPGPSKAQSSTAYCAGSALFATSDHCTQSLQGSTSIGETRRRLKHISSDVSGP
jgi:hypothetical protein